jgi:hypothetical protein
MRLPVANSQSVDFIVPLEGTVGAILPGRLHPPPLVALTSQRSACVFKGLLGLRPAQAPTYIRTVTWAIESLVPKTEPLVPLWYVTQNMPHGEDGGFSRFPAIPKRFRRPASINPKSKYSSSKIASFRFGTPDAAFPAFQLHPAAEGNPLP